MDEVHWLERPAGVRLPFTVAGADAEPARRLVFAHSLTATGVGAGPWFRDLLDDGWTVASLDQRGHGRASRVVDPALLHPSELADDLLAVAENLGWPSAWIMGASMGATPALVAAAAAPGRVDGLMLLSPAFGPQPNPLRHDLAAVAAGFEADGFDGGAAAWRQMSSANGVAPDAAEEQIERLRVHDAASLACVLRTVPGWLLPDDVIPAVGRTGMPVVVVAWDGDPVHPLSLAQQITDACPGAQLHLVAPDTEPTELFRLAAQAATGKP